MAAIYEDGVVRSAQANAGGIGGQHQYAGISSTAPATPPQTISSAISRMEHLASRLADITGSVNRVSDAIGGPRPANKLGESTSTTAASAVHRLNDLADSAHRQLTDIEEALAAIARALG